jgi:hypothetical protein
MRHHPASRPGTRTARYDCVAFRELRPFLATAGRPFSRHLVQLGTRLLIESECNRCGASMLVSSHDGSLEKWEREHGQECLGGKSTSAAQRAKPQQE